MEREAKFCLNQQTHLRLIQLFAQEFGRVQILQQNNQFFETDNGSLRQHRCSLRLRLQNQRCLLTIKQKQPQRDLGQSTGALHQHLEYERQIHCALWPQLINNAVAIHEVIALDSCIDHARAGQRLRCISGFRNQRHLWHIPDAEICLDRTTYNNGHIDYELEIESPHAESVGATIIDMLDHWKIAYRAQTQTKMARFLQHENS